MTLLRATNQITFRPVEDRDRPFLLALYAETREWEFRLTRWTEADKRDFLDQQFRAQDLSYKMQFPRAAFRIIQLDGTDIGRLYVDRPDDALHVIEFTLAPAWRERGIGTDLMHALMNEAHGGKVPVRLSVETGNPAEAFYRRLGFVPTGRTPTHLFLEWRPDTGPREI